MAVVSNESHRSIRDVRCSWGTPRVETSTSPFDDDILGDDATYSHFAVIVGPLANPGRDARKESREVLLEARDCAMLIRAGQRYGFVFEIPSNRVLLVGGISARFTDDAGLHWQIDHELHLTKLERRDW